LGFWPYLYPIARQYRLAQFGDVIMIKTDFRAVLDLNARAGLVSANRGNPFWTQSDAMRAINENRNKSTGGKQ